MESSNFLDCELYLTGDQAKLSVAGRDFSGRPALDDDLLHRLRKAAAEPVRYGTLLFEALFRGEDDALLAGFREALTLARHDGKRLRFRLHIASLAAPELHRLHWELLHDPRDGIGLGRAREVAFSRYLSVAREPPPAVTEMPRLLIVISSPTDLDDYQLDAVDHDRIRQAIEKSLQPLRGLVSYELLEGPATPARLRDRLAAGRFHALHLHAHGMVRARDATAHLVLEDEARRTRFVAPDLLAEIVEGQRGLRLVSLIACHSGAPTGADPFSGLAPTLVRRGVPAVIAMRRTISAEAASRFMEHFYLELARGGRVDSATNAARHQLYLADPEGAGWSTPVLFMRLPEGKLWGEGADLAAKRYDAFLSHARSDTQTVKALARHLRSAGLEPLLDRWHPPPGEPWPEDLEAALDDSRTCVACLGPEGLGPWENEEMQRALDQRVESAELRVIPVLLPGTSMPERGRLPAFLSRLAWVDFRRGLGDPEASHRLVCKVRGIAPAAPATELSDLCPYRGLQVFERQHAELFFGREALTQWLVERLRVSRFVAVVGPSGSGKSSVVRAGLLPSLSVGALPGSEGWKIRVMLPGHRPLEELAAQLVDVAGEGGDRVKRMLRLQDTLRADRRALHAAVRLGLAQESPETRLLLVVDQLEELFTLCPSEEQRRSFVDNLLYASGIAQGRTVVALTLRADFYNRAAAYPALFDRIAEQQVPITPMVESELRQAIAEPARRLGLELDDGLVDVLVGDVRGEPGALPLLQHALLELWERRRGRRLTLAAYRQIGGVKGALAQRAEAEYAALPEPQKAEARQILLRLVQPGEGTEDARRRASLAELLPEAEHAVTVEAVVQKLAGARLLTTGRDAASGEEQVDVAHEALIRGWPRLRRWIDRDRAALRTHRRLTEWAREWERLERDPGSLLRGAQLAESEEWAALHEREMNVLERDFLSTGVAARQREAARELRAARRLAGVIALTGLVAVVLAIFFFREKRRAEEYGRVVLARQLAAEARSSSESDPQRSLLLATEALSVTRPLNRRIAAVEETFREVLALNQGRILRGHEDIVSAVAFSPDGRRLATASKDRTVRLWDLTRRGAEPTVLRGHQERVWAVTFSPDGRWLVSASQDHTARLWDLNRLWDPTRPEATPVVLQGHEASVKAVAFSPDGRWLATASQDHTARLWDLARPAAEPAVLRGHQGSLSAIAFSPDGRWIATASHDRTARLWEVASGGTKPIVFEGHGERVRTVAFSPDSRWLATGSSDRTARLWDLRRPEAEPTVLRGHEEGVRTVDFSVDGRWLATASWDDTARLWDLSRPESDPTVLQGHKGNLWAVRFSPDGRRLATASEDHTARLWNLRRPTAEPTVLQGHQGNVEALAFSPDGRWLATASWDHTARLWDSNRSGAEPIVLEGDGYSVLATSFSADGRWLATVSQDHTVRLWDLSRPGSEPTVLLDLQGGITSAAFSSDGRWLATASSDQMIRLLDLSQPGMEPTVLQDRQVKASIVALSRETGRLALSASGRWLAEGQDRPRLWDLSRPEAEPAVLQGHKERVLTVTFSPDERWLCTVSNDRTVGLWDLSRPGAEPIILQRHEPSSRISTVAFSADGRWLATVSSADPTAQLWDLGGPGIQPIVLQGHLESVLSVTFSPGSQWLATASKDHTAQLWNLSDLGVEPIALEGHQDSVSAVAFSPDGRWLATASADHTARLWDLSRPGLEPTILRGHEGNVNAVAFSPNGRWLATKNQYRRVLLWRLNREDLIQLGCRNLARNLTEDEWKRFLGGQPYHKTCPEIQ